MFAVHRGQSTARYKRYSSGLGRALLTCVGNSAQGSRRNDGYTPARWQFLYRDAYSSVEGSTYAFRMANEADCDLLHVMVAEKIAFALSNIIGRIKNYVNHMDEVVAADHGLKEIELEYICALANDNAVTLEEILALVDNFHIDEVRERVNDGFDKVTEKLIECGDACLRRLVKMVLDDVQNQFDEVYTVPWLEGGMQIKVAIATISDYLGDFQTYLMPFWYNKFTIMLLEETTIRFAHAVLTGPTHNELMQRKRNLEIKSESASPLSRNNVDNDEEDDDGCSYSEKASTEMN